MFLSFLSVLSLYHTLSPTSSTFILRSMLIILFSCTAPYDKVTCHNKAQLTFHQVNTHALQNSSTASSLRRSLYFQSSDLSPANVSTTALGNIHNYSRCSRVVVSGVDESSVNADMVKACSLKFTHTHMQRRGRDIFKNYLL